MNKKTRLFVIIMVVFLLIGSGVTLGIFMVKNDREKNEARLKEITEEKDKIEVKLNESFKDYEESVEYLSIWHYEDLVNNLLNQDKMTGISIKEIKVNDDNFTKEMELVFDKDIKISITLCKNYQYTLNKVKREEEVTSTKEYTIKYVDTIYPVIDGVKDKTITVGGNLNILDGITATDEKEGNIEVKYEGEVNTKKAGVYTIKIYAVDKNNNRSEKEMKITVKAKSTSSGSTGSTSANGCASSATLKKRGYRNDKNACEKDKQAVEVAEKIVKEINAMGYKTDIEKVEAAAIKVSEYYQKGVHVEKGIDYYTPYGVFVKGESSCAGCTRALMLVLDLMGFKNMTHANENEWEHQWVILTMDGQVGYADGQVGWVGYGCHPVDKSCKES